MILFEGLTESQVNALVERSRMRVFAANTIVVSEGDEGNSLFIIQNGSLKAFLTDNVGREVTLSLDPGDYFGELAPLDEAPRSASVMAVTRSEVLQIPRTAFLELIEVYPACLQLVVRNLFSVSACLPRASVRWRWWMCSGAFHGSSIPWRWSRTVCCSSTVA